MYNCHFNDVKMFSWRDHIYDFRVMQVFLSRYSDVFMEFYLLYKSMPSSVQ